MLKLLPQKRGKVHFRVKSDVIGGMDLSTIKILWRQPYTLTLWGIPYLMRDDVGQSPYDLWKAWRDYVPPKPGHYGSKQIDLSDWVYLGEPGWYGNLSKEEVSAIEEFLATHKNDIPGHPCEWSVIQEG